MFNFMQKQPKVQKMSMNKEEEEEWEDMMNMMKNKWKKNKEDITTTSLFNLLETFKIIGA